MDELVYWIWLSLACSPGGATFSRLLEKYSSAREIYEADADDLYKCVSYRNSDRKSLADKSLDRASEIFDFCRKHKVGLLTYCDEAYPKSLKSISSPPVLLYYRGVLPDFNKNFCVAVVGTRLLSDYGRRNAFNISYDLARSGATIVSGMACGIDGVALAAGLFGGGSTVAVLGSGIDVCYPAQHQRLAREIVKNGCVFTEYPPGTPPNRYNFPKRNRIISGLSAATLVIEGREKSGAYITASYAKEQERAVYALPGNIGSQTSELTNLLIKNGGLLCTCADDIIRDFEKDYHGIINPFKLSENARYDIISVLGEYGVVAVCPSDDIFASPIGKTVKVASPTPTLKRREPQQVVEENKTQPPDSFDKRALLIYKRIPSDGDISVDELVDGENNLRAVMNALLKLEMNGFVRMLPGDRVARK